MHKIISLYRTGLSDTLVQLMLRTNNFNVYA